MPLTPGQILENRYRVDALLAQGGFGAVYQAWDVNLNKCVALKENLDTSPEAQRQFQHEAQILGSLTHPNLPRVQDHFLLPGQGQYLVMDFVEGEDLEEMGNRLGAPLSEDYALAWIDQVCDALVYLHGQNPPVIHRDIKPANIKITPQGKAVLVDFGLSKIYDPRLKTTVGARAVTPGYSPVEQYGRGTTDARTDIYALGATVYMLLTNHEPQESVQRTIHDDLLPAQQVNPLVLPVIGQTLHKALSLSPDQRYQTAQEFRVALANAAQIARRDRLQAWQRRAEEYLRLGQWDATEAAARQILTVDPQHAAALALLNQITQQRSVTQRYQALARTIAQAKAEAVVLAQIDPRQADPDGVLILLNAVPVAGETSARAVSAPIFPATQTASSPALRIGAIALLVFGLGAALLGGVAAAAAKSQVEATLASQSLGIGNFFFGLGAGLVALAVAWLNLAPMHTRPETAIISVVIIAATVATVLGMSAASGAISQVTATQESQNLGVGNFALGLGLSLSLGGLLLGWYSRRH